MMGRRFAAFAFFASLPSVLGQSPPAIEIPGSTVPAPIEPRVRYTPPPEPVAPQILPNSILQRPAAKPKKPLRENLVEIDPKTLTVKRLPGSWELWVNDRPFRAFGDHSDDANDVARTMRELYPLRWGRIGTERSVVEYGLTLDNQQQLVAPQVAGFAHILRAMDLKTLRVEQVRGMWCLRDDANLFLNFGRHQDDADQALGVVEKYGFNRIGTVGRKQVVLTFFTSAPEGLQQSSYLPPAVQFKMQADAMTRTGIPLPSYGLLGERKAFNPAQAEYVGEMIKINPRQVEIQIVGREHLLVSGSEVLANFGPDDYTAREAQRLVRDARLTEFCRYGTQGLTFFLSGGEAPRNMPLHTLGSRYDVKAIRIREANGLWWVTGREQPDRFTRQVLAKKPRGL